MHTKMVTPSLGGYHERRENSVDRVNAHEKQMGPVCLVSSEVERLLFDHRYGMAGDVCRVQRQVAAKKRTKRRVDASSLGKHHRRE